MNSLSGDANSLQFETPINKKPTRRSSIFKPNITERTVCKAEIYPPDYEDALKLENIKWNKAYKTFKDEFLEIRNQVHETVEHDPLENYKNYLDKAENLCCAVNHITELHENAINYRNIRRRELEQQVKATTKTIQEQLNV